MTLATAASRAELKDQSAKEIRTPISIHPDNPKYFLFRGKPIVLITATEHYGSVVNRPFDFQRYLHDAADKKQTLTRLFLLFRELQTPNNPSSPMKPESTDYIAPWPRAGPGKAKDGEPMYDLDQWNPEFFDRLHRFLSMASELGIVVELTLFSNSYNENVWSLNPLMHGNNQQGVGKVTWPDYTSLKDQELVERQLMYVRKIVQETYRYDNVYYEPCNEPAGGFQGPGAPGTNHATRAEVDAWQREVARVVREELARTESSHLVFGHQAASIRGRYLQEVDGSFAESLLDVVNVHAGPNHKLGDRTYQMGQFMSKQLKLTELHDFCLAVWSYGKPCVLDEDNCASRYRDDVGWTIHRKRAWMGVLCGTHYDFIDFSITVGSEAGTRESGRKIRTWMQHLSEFIHSFDFIHARPAPEWIESKPDHLVVGALVKPGSDYVAYLADGREITDQDSGAPIAGEVAFNLPQGQYRACLYSPVTGLYSPCIKIRGGADPVRFELPPFRHDIVLRVTQAEDPR